MTEQEHTNLALAKTFLAAVERGAVDDELAAFYGADVVQEEFPNRLMPNGARRDLAAILDGARRGQQVTSSQCYELLNAYAAGSTVVLEVQWTGVLAIPVGSLPIGGQMRARFAQFFEFRNGKIVAQRNYDCFDPW